jgi:hypothetical protein
LQGGSGLPSGAAGLVLAGALLAALLLIVAEFTTLYKLHTQVAGSVPPPSVSGHAHNSYALIPIALLAVLLAWTLRRGGGRIAIAAIGVLGLVALLIALVGDLPDARRSGLIGSAAHGYVNATARPSAGLYLETLGAVVLIATCGSGLLLGGRPEEPSERD